MTRRSLPALAEAALGVALAALGLYTFARPDTMLTAVVVVYGLSALMTGICDLIRTASWGVYTGYAPFISLASGSLSVMAGLMLVLFPGAGKFIIGLLLPLWFITHCLSRLFAQILARSFMSPFACWLTTAMNIAGIALGLALLFSPAFSQAVAGMIAGLCLILLGIEHIAGAFISL